jgi:hypothetical protein
MSFVIILTGARFVSITFGDVYRVIAGTRLQLRIRIAAVAFACTFKYLVQWR